jgi:SAM-dependent methyltransferase
MSGLIEPINPDHAEAKANLASLLQSKGRIREAIPLLMEAVALDPTHAQRRRTLAEALLLAPLNRAGAKKRSVLASLCEDENLLTFLLPSIVAVMRSDQGFQALHASARRGEDPFAAVVPSVAAFLREPLFLAALPRMQIADLSLEEVFTHVRRAILLRFESGAGSADPEIPADFVCALARQCSFWGYAFFAAKDELQCVARLREAVEAMLDQTFVTPRTLESSLAVAALYDSLHTVKGSARLLEYPMTQWSDTFRPIVQEQIENRIREREIAMQLTAITPIDDEISVAVRAQYEVNPYPRWVTLPSTDTDTIEALSKRLLPSEDARIRPRPAPVLIAGCGTGRQPISFARVYTDSQILAVDLSLSSLAYAARMTKRLGIANITYRQADILKLGTLDARFALIECCGVLHHLDDPMAGWRVLVDLLEPDGLMRIALYSEKARYAIQGAKDFALQEKFPATPEGIRACRHAIMQLPDGHAARRVLTWGDFFSLDGCRDLIMHVQEHQFTLPRVEQCLDQLGLQFLGFECATETSNRFGEMFPGGEANTNLRAWDQFEDVYPETFVGTYCFWCCRK